MNTYCALVDIEKTGLEHWIALAYRGDEVVYCDLFHSEEEAKAKLRDYVGE